MFGRDSRSKQAAQSGSRDDQATSRSGTTSGGGSSSSTAKATSMLGIFKGSSSSSNPTPTSTPPSTFRTKPERGLRPPAALPPTQYISPQALYRHQASRSSSSGYPHGQALAMARLPSGSPRLRNSPAAPPPPQAGRREDGSAFEHSRDVFEDVNEERGRILGARVGHRQANSLDSTRAGAPPPTPTRGVALDRLNTKDLPPPPLRDRTEGLGMSESNSLPSLASASSSAPPSPNLHSSALPVAAPGLEPFEAQADVRPALSKDRSSSSTAAWGDLMTRTATTSTIAPSPPRPPPSPPPLTAAPSLPPAAAAAPPTYPTSSVNAKELPKGPNTPARPLVPLAPDPATRPARPGQTADWSNLLSRASGSAPSSILGPPTFASPSSAPVSSRTMTQPESTPPSTQTAAASSSGGIGGWDALLSRASGASATATQSTSSSGAGARVAALFKSNKSSQPRAQCTPQKHPVPLDPPAAPTHAQQRDRSPSPSSRSPAATPPLSQIPDRPPPLPTKIRQDERNQRRPVLPPPVAILATPNLVSKRETRPLAPSIGITGLVRAPEGERGPRAKPQMSTSPCVCCAATLQYPKEVASFRCTVCGTITDVNLSERQAAGLGLSSDPQPLTLKRFERLLAEARAAKSPAPSIASARRDSLYEDVADARTLEGDSTDEEDGGGGDFTSAATLSLYADSNWYDTLEDELFAVFSHWSSLCGSFNNGRTPTLIDPGIDMDEVRRFYLLLSTLPPELGFAVVRGLEGLLRRPRRRFDTNPAGFAWVLLILEMPALFKPGSGNNQSSGSVLKRFLGIVSNLPNEAHHHLVAWLNVVYDRSEFERKIELINIALVPRIRKHVLAVVPPALRKGDTLSYAHDWRFRSAARVLSLFYASNAHRVRLPVSAFYVTLADQLDVVLDYETWIRTAHKKSKSSFFISQYPFLMSLGSKLRVSLHDFKRQQNEQASTSYVGQDGRRIVQPFITIRVRRERLLEDSLSQISGAIDHLKRALRIEFTNEEGIDAGGLKKEWFLLLCRELFGLEWGMWIMDDESNLCWFNPASFETDEQYTLVGVVVGLAVYHSIALDIPLPTAAFKRLLNKPVTLADLAVLRPALAKGLQDLLDFDGDIEEVYMRSFVAEYESFGEVITVPLVPGGEHIPVTANNREEYVDRLVQFILVDSVARQFRAFQRGWLSVVEGNALSLFAAEEIELCVRGSPEPLDVDHLRMVTKYDGCNEADPMISAFWELVGEWDVDRQQKLLAFVTGSDRIPAQGLVNLDFRLQVTKAPPTHLPSSHTCFNTLSLPRYPSRSALERKLIAAITESAGFGLK